MVKLLEEWLKQCEELRVCGEEVMVKGEREGSNGGGTVTEEQGGLGRKGGGGSESVTFWS